MTSRISGSLWVRWLLLCVLIVGNACTKREVAGRSGSWEVESCGTWSLKDRQTSWEYLLYRQHGTERVLVARHVRGYDFYPGDCVIFHSAGLEPAGYFAACGSHHPLRLSGPDDGWSKRGDKLVLRERRGEEIVIIQERSVEEILEEAKQQPVD